MIYENLIKHFVNRTRLNLAIVKDLAAKESGLPREERSVFEVTQLINSLLGLLVFPRERFVNHIPETPLSELLELGWPETIVSGDFPSDLHDLRGLTRYLRNAIAHFNIEFIAGSGDEIVAVKLWNVETTILEYDKDCKPTKTKRDKNWVVKIPITDLETMIFYFSEMLLAYETTRERDRKKRRSESKHANPIKSPKNVSRWSALDVSGTL